MLSKPRRVVFYTIIAERRFKVRLDVNNPEPLSENDLMTGFNLL